MLTDELAPAAWLQPCGSAPGERDLNKAKHGWVVAPPAHGNPETGRTIAAVLFAGTAHRLAQLQILAENAPDLGSLSEIYYPPVASMVLGFRREDVAHPLEGFGVLIPQVEGCKPWARCSPRRCFRIAPPPAR